MKKFDFTIRGNKYNVEIKNFEENIAEIEVNGTSDKVEVHKQIQQTKTPKLVRPEVQKDGSKQYTLLLKQRESRSGYRSIKLWISESYFILKAKGETSSGKVVEIQFSNIKTNINLPNGLFKYDIPSRARVIKNPLREQE